MAVPLYDTLNIPTGILASTTSELLLARDTDGDVKLFSGTSYLRGSGTAGYLPVYSTANALMNSVLFQSGGNMGIGLTTNIDHKLKVGGGIYGDYLQVNTAYSNGDVPGRFSWDADHDLIEVGLNTQFSARLPQDEVWSCIAATNITKGQLVYASGISGSSGKIQATPFVANGTIPARFLIGIATETAAPGDSFHAMRSGILRGVDTSMYTAGQDLWASITTVGGYQTTAPQAPNQKLSVAFVITSHTNVGELAVRIAPSVGLNLLDDVQITSPTTNQLLRYNNNRWENWTHDFARASDLSDVVYRSTNQEITGNKYFKNLQSFSSPLLGAIGTYDFENSPITIRERGEGGAMTGTDIEAPNLNFHWGVRATQSIWLDASGRFKFGSYNVFETNPSATLMFGKLILNSNVDSGEQLQVNGDAKFTGDVTAPNFLGHATSSELTNNIRWRNYGAGHVIFDASAGITPGGTTISNVDSQVEWAATYPTLMGWNGGNTFGVRVDRARVSDVALALATAGTVNRLSKFTGDGRSLGDSVVSEVGGGINISTTSFPALSIYRDLNVNEVGPAGQRIQLGAKFQGVFTAAASITAGLQANGVDGNISFETLRNNVLFNRLIITQDGNVGINTANPSRRLDIVGGHTTSTFRVFYNGLDAPSAGTASIDIWASEPGQTYDGSGIGANVNGSPYYGRIDTTRGQAYIRFLNGSIRFHANTGDAIGAERLRITALGNIVTDAGTDTGHKLQVNGDIRQTSVTNNLVFANSDGVLTAYANTASIALGTGTGGFLTKYTGSGSTQNIGNSLLYELGSNIGLNKTTPIYNFDVNGTLGVSNTLSVYSTTSSSKLDITTNANGVISTYSNHAINNLGANFFVIGRDTIFTSVAGVGYKVQIDSGTTGGKGLFVNGDIYSTATITSFSDIRLKSELERIENAIDKIRRISGYTYLFNDKRTLGLISQEVKSIAPEAIEEKGGYMTLNYQGFSAVIVEAIKELSDEIQKLKERCQ